MVALTHKSRPCWVQDHDLVAHGVHRTFTSVQTLLVEGTSRRPRLRHHVVLKAIVLGRATTAEGSAARYSRDFQC